MRLSRQAHIIHAFKKPDRREFQSFLRKNKNCRFLLSIKLPIGPDEDSSRQWERGWWFTEYFPKPTSQRQKY